MSKIVEIQSRSNVYTRSFVRLEEVSLKHQLYDGGMSEELVRINIERGDSAAALIHDTEADTIVFLEQFRFSTYDRDTGWIKELPAGVVEAGEDPRETIKREIVEEAGYEAEIGEHIASFYPSPGMCSERVHLYYVPVTSSQRTSAGGGLVEEGEDIKVEVTKRVTALELLSSGKINDAKTIIGLLWLSNQNI